MTEWTMLTKRTQAPKLTWLMRQLRIQGVEYRLNGESFHAPILEVDKKHFDQAWWILGPVDGLTDNDAMFDESQSASTAWWTGVKAYHPDVAALVGAVGLMANKVRRAIADGVKCVPEGASELDCPYATGVIPECPANLWTVCQPMARLEVFCLALHESFRMEDDARALKRVEELVKEGREATKDEAGLMSLCHVFAQWMTADGLECLVGFARKNTNKLVRAALKGTVKIEGSVVPRVTDVSFGDIVAHGFEPELN